MPLLCSVRGFLALLEGSKLGREIGHRKSSILTPSPSLVRYQELPRLRGELLRDCLQHFNSRDLVSSNYCPEAEHKQKRYHLMASERGTAMKP